MLVENGGDLGFDLRLVRDLEQIPGLCNLSRRSFTGEHAAEDFLGCSCRQVPTGGHLCELCQRCGGQARVFDGRVFATKVRNDLTGEPEADGSRLCPRSDSVFEKDREVTGVDEQLGGVLICAEGRVAAPLRSGEFGTTRPNPFPPLVVDVEGQQVGVLEVAVVLRLFLRAARTGRALRFVPCLLYTSDAADDLTRVDLGGRRI